LQAAARAAKAAATERAEQLVGKLRAAVRKGKALEAQREGLQALADVLRSQLEVRRPVKAGTSAQVAAAASDPATGHKSEPGYELKHMTFSLSLVLTVTLAHPCPSCIPECSNLCI
jgi:hypothetical protein